MMRICSIVASFQRCQHSGSKSQSRSPEMAPLQRMRPTLSLLPFTDRKWRSKPLCCVFPAACESCQWKPCPHAKELANAKKNKGDFAMSPFQSRASWSVRALSKMTPELRPPYKSIPTKVFKLKSSRHPANLGLQHTFRKSNSLSSVEDKHLWGHRSLTGEF